MTFDFRLLTFNLLLPLQFLPGTDLVEHHYAATNVGGMQVTATDATINLQCQCFCSTPPVTRLESRCTSRRQRIVALRKTLWRMADSNADGVVDLIEFRRLQISMIAGVES